MQWPRTRATRTRRSLCRYSAAGVVRRRRFTRVREMSLEDVDRSCEGIGRSVFVVAGPATPGVAVICAGVGDNVDVVERFDGVEEGSMDFDRLKLVVAADSDEETARELVGLVVW